MKNESIIKRTERLNLLLKSTRKVGRLLVKENDKENLIAGICKILVDQRGYYNAWIGLMNSDGKMELLCDSGFNSQFRLMADKITQGEFTRCIQHSLNSGDVLSINDPVQECPDCVLSQNYTGRGAMSVSLVYEEKTYGFMVLSIPKQLADDQTEKDIVKEIADDIAFGLYRLELEEKRKQSKIDIQQSQERFKALIENSLNCISIIQDNSIIYENSGLRKIHKLMLQVFNPPDFEDIFQEDRPRMQKLYGKLVSGKIKQIEADFRYFPKNKEKIDSEVRWALISAKQIDYLGVESVLTNIMDITDSKEVENFLRIQDKMTSLGRVTAGIAHEIRNPLSGVYIYLKALKKIYNQMGDINTVLSIIDKIELAAVKIESIIKRVMDFSKPGRPQFVMTNLNKYIDEVTKLTAVTLRKIGITFTKKLDATLPECYAEPHLIEQVILNLITNAAEAMKGFSGEKFIVLKTYFKTDRVIISVTDSGPGIPLAQQTKIFDPFYTTKTNSAGIGLSICHRIIVDHGGSLKFHTLKKGGAEFIIALPLKKLSEK
ncbi:MAG: ATP-binding protein [Desulfobacula sp.]|nr:ATP-binding protein [Desulfobacula sp.]